jgi:predicted enzyme related to lactoylglutathione lyase
MPCRIVHVDITGTAPSGDETDQHTFYAELFGWTVTPKGPGYALLATPDASPDGALVDSASTGVTVGVAVPDLEEALERAQALGGSVVMPRTDNGWVVKAQVADPAGNPVTLIQAE